MDQLSKLRMSLSHWLALSIVPNEANGALNSQYTQSLSLCIGIGIKWQHKIETNSLMSHLNK